MIVAEYEHLKDPEWLPGPGQTWADQPVLELQTGRWSDVIPFPLQKASPAALIQTPEGDT